jgi:hypothetical protein
LLRIISLHKKEIREGTPEVINRDPKTAQMAAQVVFLETNRITTPATMSTMLETLPRIRRDELVEFVFLVFIWHTPMRIRLGFLGGR